MKMQKEMTIQEKINAINEKEIGTNCTYWPVYRKNGKRTKIKAKAFISNSGTPVIFLHGINGYVHIDFVEFGDLMPIDSPCFSKNFIHLWP